MSNNFVSQFTRLILPVVLMAGMISPIRAESAGPTYSEPGMVPNLPKEAATATFGRSVGATGEYAEIDYYVLEFGRHTRFNSSLRSALLPGWGQGFNGDRTKGTVMFLAFGALMAGTIAQVNRANDLYGDYRDEGRVDGTKYDDYDSARTQALILGVLTVGLWTFSVVDAYRGALAPLYSNTDGLKFAVAPHGDSIHSQLFWKKHF